MTEDVKCKERQTESHTLVRNFDTELRLQEAEEVCAHEIDDYMKSDRNAKGKLISIHSMSSNTTHLLYSPLGIGKKGRRRQHNRHTGSRFLSIPQSIDYEQDNIFPTATSQPCD